jgi:bifunctional DNA-binding transcriptional regulator/antitoxin component of YhaV-PrlF toxin-antitoxin module
VKYPENVNMTIPPEVAEAVGLEPGDPIKIMVGDQGTIIIEKLGEEENSDVEE